MTRFRPLIRATFFLLPLLLLSVSPASALDCVHYADYLRIVGSSALEGGGDRILIDGELAFIAGPDRLKVFDVSSPTDPILLSTSGEVGSQYLSLQDDLGYVTFIREDTPEEEVAGFQIMDFSDPSAPTLLGEVNTYPVILGASAILGDHLLIQGSDGLRSYDVSDPGAPFLAATYAPIADGYDLLVDGDLLYAGVDATLHVLDVSDPLNPAPVSSFGLLDQARGMELVADLLYVTESVSWNSWLQVLDVSDPAALSEVGNLAMSGRVRDVSLLGDVAFVASYKKDLQVVDVATPSAPALLGQFRHSYYANGVACVGDQVLVSTHNDASPAADSWLHTVDASNPTFVPTLASEIALVAEQMVVEDDLAYCAAGENDFVVLDLGDPAAPAVLSQLELPGEATRLALQDGIAYIAAGDGGLQIVDASTPASPFVLSEIATDFDAVEILANGNEAYLVLLNGDILAIDVSSPDAPSLLDEAHVGSSYRHRSAVIHRDRLFVEDYDEVVLIDVAEPGAMVPFGSFDFSYDGSRELRLAGDTLIIGYSFGYLPGQGPRGSGLRLYGLSPADEIVPMDIVGLPANSIDDLAVRGSTIYASAEGVIHAVDFSDPWNMTRLGQFGFGTTQSLAAGADLLAISDDVAGSPDVFLVAPFDCSSLTAVPDDAAAPARARLAVHPNPFNPTTFVSFALPMAGRAELTVHGVDGRLVRNLLNANLPAGEHRVEWDGRDDTGRAQSSGVYLLRYVGPSVAAQEKLVLIR